jgi:hypothetical protein
MSDANLNPDEAAQRARDLIEADVNAKVDAVRELVAAVNEADAAQARLNEATAAHGYAWKAAIAAGWTEKDLRATGARPPGPAVRKPRSKRRTATNDSGSSE